MTDKLTDKEIVKALECCVNGECPNCPLSHNNTGVYNERCGENLMQNALDLINRLQEKVKKFENRQKPTGASGYKIENGKVVFFTNMLGGCKIVKENLEEVVKTLNELLQEAYAKDEIAFALKCKTEELKKAETENERLNNAIDEQDIEIAQLYKRLDKAKAEAYKEFAERLKNKAMATCKTLDNKYRYEFDNVFIDNLLKELVGD